MALVFDGDFARGKRIEQLQDRVSVALPLFGQRNPELGLTFNSIDPLGWANLFAFDPWAYAEWNTATNRGFTGIGACSVNLFKPGAEFRYP